MGWIRTGQKVSGKYLGKFDFTGIITDTRVKFGGDLQHTVKLDEVIQVFGETKDVLLIDEYSNIFVKFEPNELN